MKRVFAVSALIAGLGAGAASAATITWGAATNLTDDNGVTDVSTTGTLVEAVNLNHSSSAAVTVNGVLFDDDDGTAYNAGGYNVAGVLTNGDTSGRADSALLTNTTDYFDLLDSSVRGTSPPKVFSVGNGNLEVGEPYLIQVWYSDHNRNEGRTSTITAGNSVALSEDGQYAIGTFTATDTSQTLSVIVETGAGAAKQSGFNAYQVRLVPEPGSLALLGLSGLCVLRRRRG